MTRRPTEVLIRCHRCRYRNREGNRFCTQCGAALTQHPAHGQVETVASEILPADAAAGHGRSQDPGLAIVARKRDAVRAFPPGSAMLEMRSGPTIGGRFLLDREVVTVGRHPHSDIFCDDLTVSRLHAEFRRDTDGFSVHDVGSLNGTYVNHRSIVDSPLSSGDEVQIGKFGFVYLTTCTPSDQPSDECKAATLRHRR